MVVINRCRYPRAFKAIGGNISRLPPCISWKWNKKAWMNTEICSSWLKDLDKKMKKENRNVLLFMDNFSAHEAAADMVELTNIQIEFLPPNCTSLVQPIDQGIGESLKSRYRKSYIEHMPNMVLLHRNPHEGFDLLRVGKAWNSLNG